MKIDLKQLAKESKIPKYTTPIGLIRPTPREVGKSEQITFSLRAVPTKTKSPTYALSIPFFDTGTCEEWILTKQAIIQACEGQNLTDAPEQYTLARRVLKADALAAFNAKAKELKDETLDNFVACLQGVTEHVFPEHALKYEKKYILHAIKKPKEMPIRRFVARVVELESYLHEFPPFKTSQRIKRRALLDMLETAIPYHWKKEMKHFRFDPIKGTLAEFVQFCERFESDEETPKKRSFKSKLGNRKRTHEIDSDDDSESGKRQRSSSWCKLHGENSHTTKECNVLKKMIADKKEEMRARKNGGRNKEGKSGKRNGYANRNNQDWKSRQDAKRKREKEELHTFIQHTVTDAVTKAVKVAKQELAMQEAEEQLDNMSLQEFNYDVPDDVSKVSSGVTMGTVEDENPKEKQD